MSSTKQVEFHSALHQQLKDDGVLNEVTASVRATILLSLLIKDDNTTLSATNPKQNTQDTAILSLIYHFLDEKYPHTLSVFAAESKLEDDRCRLSPACAIKELGLEQLWAKLKKDKDCHQPIDFLLLLLQYLSSSQHANTTSKTSVYVQTDDDKENSIFDNNSSSKRFVNAMSILEIERECQQRLRQEMNEKLRLSAKKQAIEASRRLEHKHKESILSLRRQIDDEKSQAERREAELTQKLNEQQVLAVNERRQLETRLEKSEIDNQEIQREMELGRIAKERELRQLKKQQMISTNENQAHRAELEASQNNIASLRALLRRSQSAIESISFREIGKVRINTDDRTPTRTLQLGPPSSVHHSIMVEKGSITMAETRPQHVTKPQNDDITNKQQNESSGKIYSTNLQRKGNEKPHTVQSVEPEDPPCSSGRGDPPENDDTTCSVERGCSGGSSGGIILNISAITEAIDSTASEVAGVAIPEKSSIADGSKTTYSAGKTNKGDHCSDENDLAKSDDNNSDDDKDATDTQSIKLLLPSTTVYRNTKTASESDDGYSESFCS